MNIYVALPCIHFSVKEREIIRKYGLMAYPEFLDNHYVQERTAMARQLDYNIERAKELGFRVYFAIYPDYDSSGKYKWLLKHDDINWIYPLHKIEEIEKDFVKDNFEWIGYPYREAFRNYDLQKYFNITARLEKKRWYLGFWDEARPYTIQYFHGLDSTLPETYSGKFGKIWVTWRKAYKPNPPQKTIEMFEQNVKNFKREVQLIFDKSKLHVIPLDRW